MCDRLPSAPVLVASKVVCVVPSPQLTSTCHGPSRLLSVKEPRSNDVAAPSLTDRLASAVIVGLTLFVAKVAENSEVLPAASVAVAVRKSLVLVATVKTASKEALPLASVVT